MAEKSEERAEATARAREREAQDQIAKALRGLQFGEVTVIVQDGIVVQVERTERVRLQRSGSKR